MALASTLKFSQFLIKLGDGATPEAFNAPCGLNSRGFKRTAATSDVNVPDCDNPDAPSWLQRDVTSLSGELSGAGVVADEDFDVWENWLGNPAVSKNVQITLGNRVWLGPMKLTQLDITGALGKRNEVAVTMMSDGPIVLQTA
jgi:hypothetical protein